MARSGSLAWCNDCDSNATSCEASRSGRRNRSPLRHSTLVTRRLVASALARSRTSSDSIDTGDTACPASCLDRKVSVAAPDIDTGGGVAANSLSVRDHAAQLRPGGGCRATAVRVELYLPVAEHLLQPGIVFANRPVGGGGELFLE